MLKNKSIQCLGWCPDSQEARGAFLHRDNDPQRPKRVYEDRAWWCPECWRDDSAGAYDRFHSLYVALLQRYVDRKTRAFFPPHLRPDVTGEVTADTMRVIWEGWEGFAVPERVMYTVAYRTLLQRVPKQNRPLMLPFSELPELLSEKEQRAQDDPLTDLEEQLFLDELIAGLPEPQRSYVRERLTGATLGVIADRAGRSKSTVSEGLRHATKTMRTNVEEVLRYVSLMASVLGIIKWVVPALIALLAMLGISF
ncbi:RNA polymerase sigma factor [Streptomyces chartreusis]|uniref:Sigma-70 family RNA polymerase sigma factor n=1 Tax=Streptomyces chartreusis TaxID=1969 RepID=A0A7H8TA34_STRCX|nr:sigma-70 family RNA polymerase sigma factor [Streptomyces chartreusis]QKZ20351.1 sigma-70 family RNA polymerase sigma factor [Streptomyces chartreusis]